ncbi:hypothetical protein GPECTOR_6g484 [Gonium pectorale]|uniref:Uncharacterized protein n=1 Tax=Gonium pectorale TaxID=33097 RepID=A0A150GUL5_GONPE|nr:hypothetical protein GPECTOR_6g484 [Gonium pectorale]|eukprot:KXZ53567.1 hypothetical protein GPECTOR_6g484 [Gonium pectorale]
MDKAFEQAFERLPSLIYTGASIVAAGAAFAWRAFMRFARFLAEHAASAAQPAAPLQLPVATAMHVIASSICHKQKGHIKKSKCKKHVAIGAEKQPCATLALSHVSDHKKLSVKRQVVPVSRPRHEHGLSAALLECALRAAAKDGVHARSCRRQQAAAVKTSLAQNELQRRRGHGRNARKADASNGRKAARSPAHKGTDGSRRLERTCRTYVSI